MSRAIALFIVLFFFSPSYGATIYQWVDKNGTYNFVDDYEKVPSAYRDQVHLKKLEDVLEVGPPEAAPQPKEARKDRFGQGEEWWREKVGPWERQLEEASENYQMANQEFLKESDNLILRKYGSHQQFVFGVLGMYRMRWRRAAYEAKVIEAKEMLKKISREAEESKADPQWLQGTSAVGYAGSVETTETDADIYGGDGAWWKEKLFTLREQLRGAVENYEKTYGEYMEIADKLGPSRFGGMSLTQYQMMSNRLDILSSEMARYQVEITEAEEMIKKLVKEAEVSKANPNWVK